ncbi:MAG: hypothetical protein ACR2H4_18725 [Pyrinomonadaceae bacterium]|jgi:hypothetical protein
MRKKNSTTKKKGARRETIKQRARAILDSDQYDVDTRKSIQFMLQRKNDPDLADMVARAEQGEMILDTVRVGDENKRAARMVLNLLDSEIIPLWLREAVEDALNFAYQRRVAGKDDEPLILVRRSATGEWLGAEKHLQVKKNLAMLFDLTPGLTFTLHLSERAKLAQAISTILDNESTPARLYNEVADFVVETSNELYKEWRESPETIEKILATGQCGSVAPEGNRTKKTRKAVSANA